MKRLKKPLLSILSLALLISVSPVAGAEQSDVLPEATAKADAANFVKISKSFYPNWKDKGNLSVKKEQDLFDFDGNLNAYLFSVTDDAGKKHGYIIESAIANHPGMLEAATDGESPFAKTKPGNGIYVGVASYFEKADADSFLALNLKGKQDKIEKKSLQSSGSFNREKLKQGKAAVASTTIAAAATASSGKYIYGVPDYQWTIGCVPTSAANIVSYWSKERGYSNLTRASNGSEMPYIDIISTLANYMNTDSRGGTSSINAITGSKQYWRTYGSYNLEANGYSYFTNYKNEIDKYRPALVLVTDNDTPYKYGDHAVTGVGYQILDNGQQNLIIHDTWDNTPVDVIYPWGNHIKTVLTQEPK
ncbi:C39 family peptidase [Paenibacillus ehimensis]|uniref:C39 family peptidase n=1 Tax=Paenibacillus ehimensis TaxID=79264 RepID=A0ABT8V3L4_9BACL|nr:C39 family peptidase [Paenibacillus ehimensis]MDO3676030.1 C39 family peptidase [Paenibacillus ehimensis]